MKLTTTVVLLLVLAAGVSHAEEKVLLAHGGSIQATIEEVDLQGVSLSMNGGTMRLGRNNLDPFWFYQRVLTKVGDDPDAMLDLAVFCFEHGLFNQAGELYAAASQVDPERVKEFEATIVPQIKEGVAERMLGQARRAVKRRDLEFAERTVAAILTELPETKVADEARDLIVKIHYLGKEQAEEERRERAEQAAQEREDAARQAAETTERVLEPIERRIHRAEERSMRALRTRSNSRARSEMQAAIRDLLAARTGIERALASDPPAALRRRLETLHVRATKDAVEGHVHIGSTFLVRGSYNQALREANAALAIDPQSPYAQSFHRRVVEASQFRAGGWWVR